jgi:hypothetical protein
LHDSSPAAGELSPPCLFVLSVGLVKKSEKDVKKKQRLSAISGPEFA